jgi:hypothetical protein
MTNFKIDGSYGTNPDTTFISAGKVRAGLTFVGQMPKYAKKATIKSHANTNEHSL